MRPIETDADVADALTRVPLWVAASAPDDDGRVGVSESRSANGERRLEVQVDVVGERLQRRDVQHLDTPSPTPLSGNVSRALRSGHGTGAVQTIRLSRHQAVDGREERA